MRESARNIYHQVRKYYKLPNPTTSTTYKMLAHTYEHQIEVLVESYLCKFFISNPTFEERILEKTWKCHHIFHRHC